MPDFNKIQKNLLLMAIMLTIGLAIQILLPFPYGLGLAIAFFIFFPMFLKKQIMSGNKYARYFGPSDKPSMSFVCIVCHKKFKGRTCPRCGSTTSKADFG